MAGVQYSTAIQLTEYPQDQLPSVDEAWRILKNWEGVFTLEIAGERAELLFTPYVSTADHPYLQEVGKALQVVLGDKKPKTGPRRACSAMDGYFMYAVQDEEGFYGPTRQLFFEMRKHGIDPHETIVHPPVEGVEADSSYYPGAEVDMNARYSLYQNILQKLLRDLKRKGITPSETLLSKLAEMVADYVHSADINGIALAYPPQEVAKQIAGSIQQSEGFQKLFGQPTQTFEDDFLQRRNRGNNLGF